MRFIIIIACVLTAAPALAQGESTLGAEISTRGRGDQRGLQELQDFREAVPRRWPPTTPCTSPSAALRRRTGSRSDRRSSPNARSVKPGDSAGAVTSSAPPAARGEPARMLKMVRTGRRGCRSPLLRAPDRTRPPASTSIRSSTSTRSSISLPTVSSLTASAQHDHQREVDLRHAAGDRGNQRDLPHHPSRPAESVAGRRGQTAASSTSAAPTRTRGRRSTSSTRR